MNWYKKEKITKAERGKRELKEAVRQEERQNKGAPETEKSRGETQCRQTDMTFFHCGLASRHRTEEGFVSWGAFQPLCFLSLSPPTSLHDWVWVRTCLMLSWLYSVALTLQQQANATYEVNKPKGDGAEFLLPQSSQLRNTLLTGNSYRHFRLKLWYQLQLILAPLVLLPWKRAVHATCEIAIIAVGLGWAS